MGYWEPVLKAFTNAVNHILISLYAIYFTSVVIVKGFESTTLHMILTAFGFHVLGAEALLAHYRFNIITRWLSYRNRSRFHGTLLFAGGSMALYGSVIHIFASTQHFDSLHGKVGLASTIACCGNMVWGLVNIFEPKFVLDRLSPSELNIRHNFYGILTYSLGMWAIYLSYDLPFFFDLVNDNFIRILKLGTLTVYFFTIVAPTSSMVYRYQKRKRRIESELCDKAD